MTKPAPLDHDFHESTSPVESPPSRRRGCFFYGCLAGFVLMVVSGVGIGTAVYSVGRLVLDPEILTDAEPMPLPEAELPEAERAALDDRIGRFEADAERGRASELVLTADEINALIAEEPDLKGRLHVRIRDDRIRGQISIPTNELDGDLPPTLRDRYFNGSATLRASIRDGRLDLRLEEVEVNGRQLPGFLMNSLRSRNLTEEVEWDDETRAHLDRVDRLEVRDGAIALRLRGEAEAEAEAGDGDGPRPAGPGAGPGDPGPEAGRADGRGDGGL